MNFEWPVGAKKDCQSVTRDWDSVNRKLISGVLLKEVRNVPGNSGMLTEVFRQDWFAERIAVDQVFQVRFQPGTVSAWHAHAFTTDRLFVNSGMMLIVLYDGRRGSSTFGLINEFRCGLYRPSLAVIPPQVWHGVANTSCNTASLLNLVDQAYRYDDPDNWRLPQDTPEIPYRFPMSIGGDALL